MFLSFNMLNFLYILKIFFYSSIIKKSSSFDFSAFSLLGENLYNFATDAFHSGCEYERGIDVLNDDLRSIYGQHIAISELVSAIRLHVKSSQPQHALSIILAGGPGTGKTYIANKVAHFLFKHGSSSPYANFFYYDRHFPEKSTEMIQKYRQQLNSWVHGNITKCPRSLFVFDEVEKMPNGLIDSIRPFLDYNQKVDGIDPRRAIFLFLSNQGSSKINSYYMQLLGKGLDRHFMQYYHYENLLRDIFFENTGLFRQSLALSQHLISRYIPFLPMEQEHVVKCIQDEFLRQNFGFSERKVRYIMDNLMDFEENFSTYGCKRVGDHVNVVSQGLIS